MKLKEISPRDIPKDIITGIIIAFVSIPISMGYAQVSGISPVYGLYGSVFPILIYGLLSTSKQFIFGVDAAPAALAGAYIISAGAELGSERAEELIPVISFFTAVWLFLLYLLKAGKTVRYISTPVMGGFISGISTTIILMQIPKLLGGTSGRGELFELAEHIIMTCRESFNGMSLVLGGVSLAVLLISKKLVPRLPMSVPVMIAGAVLGYTGFADKYSVARLSAVRPGLPEWSFPHIMAGDISGVLSSSLTIAIVIMAETLLASGNLANKNGYAIKSNREILVYALGNLAASLTGCCPVNGSVSRSSMADQYGGKSQIMSVSASVTMAVILMFGTGAIKYLPVPVLTAIVISALLGAVEFHLIKRLFRQDKRELFIFFGAFSGVLLLGTVYGVMIGVVLSFVSVIIATASPKRSFLGVIHGREGFHSLERNTYSVPLKGAVIYRFSGNLYFANVNLFEDDIIAAVREDTRCVVVDSGAVCSIDITAADKIASMEEKLRREGIKFYFASHIGTLNDRFRQLGIGGFVESGHCRRTITSALADAGFTQPYELEESDFDRSRVLASGNQRRLEFEWAFGAMADEEYEKYTEQLLSHIDQESDPEKQLHDIVKVKGFWKDMSDLDHEEILTHIEAHIHELSEQLHISEETVAEAVEERKLRIAKRLGERDGKALDSIREHTRRFEAGLREHEPELYERLIAHRREALEHLRKQAPEYGKMIDELYGGDDE